MQRRIPIKARTSTYTFEDITSDVVDQVYNHIKCQKFVIFSLYSKKLTDALSKSDREKAVYIFDVNKFGADGMDKNLNIVKVGAKPEELPSIAEEINGAIAFFDARENIQGFHGLIKTCKGFSNFVVFLPPGMDSLPLNDPRWISHIFIAKGQKVQLFENSENTDCSAALIIAEQIYEQAADSLEAVDEVVEEKAPVSRQSRDSTKPPRSPSVKKEEEDDESFNPQITLRTYQEIIDSFPAPYQGKGYTPLTAEWEDDFMKYIESLVSIYVPNLDSRITSQLFTADKRAIWIRAFISSSYNFNNDSNYELLELVGDGALESCFRSYMVAREPNLTEEVGSRRSQNYLGGKVQAYTGKKMEVDKWVVHKISVLPDKVSEDVLEAWCGALQTVGDLVVNGLGYTLVHKFVENIFDKVDFGSAYDYETTTLVKQYLIEKYKWDIKPIFDIVDGVNKYTLIVSGDNYIRWMNKFYADLSLDFKKIPLKIIARGSGRVKSVAEKEAYEELVNKLVQLGITPSIFAVKDFFNSSIAYDPKVKPVAEAVLEKARAIGVVRFFIADPGYIDKGEGSIKILVGILSNGRYVNLYTKFYPFDTTNDTARKINLLESYLNE